MEIILTRKYGPNGTNGTLYINGRLICFTIELPWHQNRHKISCIPEGLYNLQLRYSSHLGHHIEVCDVPNRSMILIHAANNALLELEGCIAPVMQVKGEGLGNNSKEALEKLISAIKAQGNKTVFLNIQKQTT